MSKEEKRVPEVRFEGFYDDWKQRKLGDISEKVTEKNKDKKFTETFTNSAEYGIVPQNDFFDKVISNSKNISNYYIVQNDDFIYNPRISNFAPVGPIKRNKLNKVGVMSPLYYVFRTKNIDLTFLEKFFDTSYWHRFMKLNGDTGARADRFAIKDSVFKEMPVPYPSSDEQTKIGNLLKQIDRTIALHQRKLEQLRELKKAALQYLFPKKDEAEPKVRFANFMDDRWSSYKIKDIFLERLEKSGEGELISVTINSGVVKASELDRKDNSSLNKTNYKSVKRHDIAYNSMRMWQGASGYSPYNGIVSPAYTVITPKQGINSKFFSFMFKKNEMIQAFKRNSQGLTSDTWNLKFPVLSSIKVKVPKTEEQDKIEQYMNNLDNIIKLYQGKLENFQDTKKAFLQKMFI
ncbi:restriction endonuclease subunit S [Tetragenococcus halophilus]|uniref:restriction endonuclease subunit S n=3 Tax=Tetragenococcus halophilus TaxID=51669 RepID=UPI0009F62E08|nr:restriction endonuclease subunit S [Tetragenococcus halophilus]